jgi:hypothetical protein
MKLDRFVKKVEHDAVGIVENKDSYIQVTGLSEEDAKVYGALISAHHDVSCLGPSIEFDILRLRNDLYALNINKTPKVSLKGALIYSLLFGGFQNA